MGGDAGVVVYGNSHRATMEWYRSKPAAEQATLRAGISAVREKEVLAAWHAKQGGN